MKKSHVVVILGQTATGKSALAVKIALKLAGEIISADSRQVYTGLNIGTGKISTKEMKGVPHHLLDVANPKRKFTVTQYQKLANEKIEEIIARGHVPIIVGGTGFYIDAVTKGIIFPQVPPNPALRKKLSLLDGRQVLIELKKLDPQRAKNIDPHNLIRIIRAIEIAKALGKVPKVQQTPSKYTFIKVGLSLPEDQLKKKVSKRVNQMFANGLLKEIKKLKKSGISNKRLQEFGFEYFEPTEEKVIAETIKYAKRQMTWFKRDGDIRWFSPTHLAPLLLFVYSQIPGKTEIKTIKTTIKGK